ncbi:ATP-binding protein [Clostridium sp. Marseille-P2415]|uniref:ATP-binding protein n=1 Tax=Clostridium sp. Marseille-P2415 TaxID=1805471 RepID=UPI0009884AD1|nr:AAA family ATPase [Clostridium sp. Marseille-P2415]
MKILDIYINGFGKFHDRNLSFRDGLNIVYGKNEAGKSTIHTFIRGMLFGIERQRGRASRNDLYTKYEPWENSGTYEGQVRLEHKDHIYRIERTFHKNKKEFKIVDETAGREVEPTKAFLDDLLCGLSEAAYINTVSIGQLKSATDEGMVSELKNYIANLNTTGNLALNITKAAAFLKSQRKELESQMVPEAARTYTSLLSEIRNTEKDIASPEYENQIQAYQKLRSEVKNTLEELQKEKEELLQKAARGRQVLSSNQFSDQESINVYSGKAQETFDEYTEARTACGKKPRKICSVLSLIIATVLLCSTGVLYYLGESNYFTAYYGLDLILLLGVFIGAAIIFYLIGLILFLRLRHSQKDMEMSAKILQEILSRHLGNTDISTKAIQAFQTRMAEFTRLCSAVTRSEAAIAQKAAEIEELQKKQEGCGESIEKQQKSQWELEKKLEHLSNCKTQAEGLKHILAENDRIREEISAIDLALETMTSLSSSIRDSFGLYLNKTASDLIAGITGGIYTSMSVDENLNVFLNTKTKLVPLEQVSSGTMDQVYLALRLAAATLIQEGTERMPFIFDDSFVLYDDDRLRTALKWLVGAYSDQVIIFTCHQREAQMLTANLIPYHLVEI